MGTQQRTTHDNDQAHFQSQQWHDIYQLFSTLPSATDSGLNSMAEGSGTGVVPEAGPSTANDVWGQILDSVKSTRAVATKNLIVLGKLETHTPGPDEQETRTKLIESVVAFPSPSPTWAGWMVIRRRASAVGQVNAG